MKKLLGISLILLLSLGACSNSEDNNQSSDKSEQSTDEKTLSKTKTFLNYSYTKNDIKQMKDYEDIISKQLRDRVSNQNQTYDTQSSNESSVENVTLYKETETNQLKVFYVVKVKTTDDKEKNIDYTERFGRIEYKNEDNKMKINKMQEVGSNPYQ
ncbi:TrsH/TraH family protein [Staphylococcus equorum]|uniref:TrsH/TraH family protein n=1 Tax=Staphylococcus equorum TaxID=246432 RepID=UPI0021C2144F|nr:TrsH/TraH family protein [Staphylococcus equorum]